jgi:hypothetical protein
MKLTEAQRREWDRLVAGGDADLDTLERAGLVASRVEIRLAGPKLTREEAVWLTEADRALLKAEGEK